MALCGCEAKVSAISTENASTIKKTSIHEVSSIKLTKYASILHSPKKIKCLAPRLVTCARQEVTLLDAYILHGVYSAFNTFPFIINVLYLYYMRRKYISDDYYFL